MCFFTKQYDPSHYKKTHPHRILQVPTTQLANMSIDSKFVELKADVLDFCYSNIINKVWCGHYLQCVASPCHPPSKEERDGKAGETTAEN